MFNSNLFLGLTYFSNSFENLFGTDNNFRTINIGKAETKGIEFYATYKPNKKIRFNFNYTYTNSKNKDVNSTEYNLELLRRPQNKATISFDYKLNSIFNIYSDISYFDIRIDKNFSTYPIQRVTLESYILSNLSVNAKIFKNFTIFGKLNNLFNTDYEEVYGYGTAKRSGYFGLKINL